MKTSFKVFLCTPKCVKANLFFADKQEIFLYTCLTSFGGFPSFPNSYIHKYASKHNNDLGQSSRTYYYTGSSYERAECLRRTVPYKAQACRICCDVTDCSLESTPPDRVTSWPWVCLTSTAAECGRTGAYCYALEFREVFDTGSNKEFKAPLNP